MIAITYDYPAWVGYADTTATLADGRQVEINTQYRQVRPLGRHPTTCAQVAKMGGVCDCGLIDGIDVAALVAEARVHGKFGKPARPAPAELLAADSAPARGVCPRCGTYCEGDCRAH